MSYLKNLKSFAAYPSPLANGRKKKKSINKCTLFFKNFFLSLVYSYDSWKKGSAFALSTQQIFLVADPNPDPNTGIKFIMKNSCLNQVPFKMNPAPDSDVRIRTRIKKKTLDPDPYSYFSLLLSLAFFVECESWSGSAPGQQIYKRSMSISLC